MIGRHALVLTALACLSTLAACGSDGSAETTDTAATIPLVSALPTEPANDQPAGEPSTTGGDTGTDALDTPDTLVIASATPPVEVTDSILMLEDGVEYRADLGSTRFAFEGRSGWGAYASANALSIALPGDPLPITITVLRLHDAHPSSGLEGADPTGLAVPADPFVASADVTSADGVPNVAALRDLPEDPLDYVESLPGVTLERKGQGNLGALEGEVARVSVSGLPSAPDAVCAGPNLERCITTYLELGYIYFFGEGDTGTIIETEAGGERFEVSVVDTADNGLPDARRTERDAIVQSLRVLP